MNSLVLNSYAKLNLFLEVVNKRKDNYHNLRTLFERIDLSDKVILKPRRDGKIKIICKNYDVPKNSSNLCYRSAKLLQEIFNIDKGLDIRIIKRIPVGAGLGGGSSNAACVLIGLNRLWKLNISKKRLADIAGRIGCDVPFFIYDVAFAQAAGRGDEIKALNLPERVHLWHVLAVPKLAVSTPFIYRKWDQFSGLTMPRFDVKLLSPLEIMRQRDKVKLSLTGLTSALRKNDLSLINEFLFNGLEPLTVKYYPQVQSIKEKLNRLGLKTILMSGSGPAVFGIVSSRKEAVTIARKVKEKDGSLHVFATRTI